MPTTPSIKSMVAVNHPITSISSAETLAAPSSAKKSFPFSITTANATPSPNLVFLPVGVPAAPTANQQAAFNYLQARANSWIRTQNQNVYLGKADWRLSNNELL